MTLGVCHRITNYSYSYVDRLTIDNEINPPTYTHNGCACNEFVSFRYRHQQATKQPTNDMAARLYGSLTTLNDLAARTGTDLSFNLASRLKVVRSYRGRFYKRYFQAYTELTHRSLLRTDFLNNAFVKPDKEEREIVYVATAKGPRMIQYMRATGALEMGRFTHAVESKIYAITDQFGTKVFGKGCNLHELAEDFVVKRSNFSDPIFLLLDASSFDAHVSAPLLRIVSKWYGTILRNSRDRAYVRWLWSHTYVNRGRTTNGLKFKTQGTRMSGHMDTGLGNSLIMYAMLTEYLKTVGVQKYSMSVNGDDSVIIIERSDLRRASDLSIFDECGFKMKFEYTDRFSQMEYCQCKPVETHYGWIMARSPERLLRRVGWSVHRFGKKMSKHYVYSLGLGEMAINYGLPIGYALGVKLREAACGAPGAPPRMLPVNRKKYISATRQRYWQSSEPAIVSDLARESYEEAWGISPDDQVALEEALRVKLDPTLDQDHLDWFNEYVDGALIGTHPV